ncbi:MAG: GNAT family N-acetyltransferase [Acidimicrobiales bacterium]|nr:GNAT family N-acetyltransferase [Acidimicrobiales bacterium]
MDPVPAERTSPPRRAAALARVAAAQARISMVEVVDPPGVAAAERLLTEIWGNPPERSVLPSNVLRALQHSGAYVFLARAGDLDVGASVAWWAVDAGRLHLHSHITGVVPGVAGRGVGRAIKLHQRAWALERGVEVIRWTFDPLVRRNAFFNLTRLGATAERYHVDFYGSMPDAVNAGDETDRIEVAWWLASSGVDAAVAVTTGGPSAEGAACVLLDDHGEPVVVGSAGAERTACATPPDAVALRSTDPRLARRWRHALRDVLGGAMADGWRVDGFTRSGSYLLRRP